MVSELQIISLIIAKLDVQKRVKLQNINNICTINQLLQALGESPFTLTDAKSIFTKNITSGPDDSCENNRNINGINTSDIKNNEMIKSCDDKRTIGKETLSDDDYIIGF